MTTNPLKDLSTDRPTEVVEIRGKKIVVVGLSGGDISRLVTRFPEVIRMAVSGKISPEILIRDIPQAIPAIIAAGFRKMGDEEFERDAAEMSVDDWLSFVEKIVKATMPDGPGPLVKRLTSMAQGVGVGAGDESASGRKLVKR